jgi:hypothetical protein
VITGVKIAEGAGKVIEEILLASGNPSCLVTSVERTPKDQARVMAVNCEDYDKIGQIQKYKSLYKAPGQAVVQAWIDNKGKPKAAILAAMAVEISRQGAERVSAHCRGPESPVWVIDIAPSSLKDFDKFIEEAEKHARVTKVLKPPKDPAGHLEILKIG